MPDENDILELPVHNPHKQQVIDYLTSMLISAEEDNLRSFFLVGERASDETVAVCWTSAVRRSAFNAAILKHALRKLGMTDSEDVKQIFQDDFSGGI